MRLARDSNGGTKRGMAKMIYSSADCLTTYAKLLAVISEKVAVKLLLPETITREAFFSASFTNALRPNKPPER